MIQFTGYRYTENLRADIRNYGVWFAFKRVRDDAMKFGYAEWELRFWLNWVLEHEYCA